MLKPQTSKIDNHGDDNFGRCIFFLSKIVISIPKKNFCIFVSHLLLQFHAISYRKYMYPPKMVNESASIDDVAVAVAAAVAVVVVVFYSTSHDDHGIVEIVSPNRYAMFVEFPYVQFH